MSTRHPAGHLHPPGLPRGNPWELWRLGFLTSELWFDCAQALVNHANWLAPADPARAAARRAWQRRWSRGALTGFALAMQAQRAGYDLWFGRRNPWCASRQPPRPAPGAPAAAPAAAPCGCEPDAPQDARQRCCAP